MGSPEGNNWVFDCPLIDDFPPSGAGFLWAPQQINGQGVVNHGVEINASSGDLNQNKEASSNKRSRSESCSQPSSKACREKLRRDRLNERFLELGSVLEPGKTPKMDKSAIINDAIRMVTELRGEAKKLKDSNESLQEKIKELKAEKNELRDEKQRLKAEKEALEQQVKLLSVTRPPMPVIPAPAFAAPGPVAAAGAGPHKLMMPIISYPGFPMWQFMPPADVDTSQDPESCPPVA
ncbi:basic helix-loop-helix (bHLH) DNA-binding superfamily protein [Rhynchospora pubera]|uniref:Basic helix-loop-helix (BHLH) DNA-binding superfamily protein n=1 Tax=Rhynchospora pubera TaxID=906938 RepID=A0AAV8GCU4_9POAL|nr:basic helix-loop-helix (bHLH) DNA-binding superfamily protein [Rhynchospora pubera]